MNSIKRNTAVPASYLILRRGEKILFTKRKGSGYYDGWYGLPAGHIEDGELPTECLIRETKEEIGLDISKNIIKLAHIMYRVKNDETGNRVDYFFVVENFTGEPKIMEHHKCDDMQWFSIDSLPENTVHHTQIAIKNIQKGILFSELGTTEVHLNPTQR